jgi:nucleoside-diphosphate-sugar epimerase
MSPERVIVTGASGFIGSQVLAPLMRRGYEVHAVGRRPPAEPAVSFHEVDLLDRAATERVVSEVGASHLLHLAWYAEHGRFWLAAENLDWVSATLLLLRAFAEAGGTRAVLAGTCAEYDWDVQVDTCRELDGPLVPATPLRPGTLYGAAMHATHLVAAQYAATAGLSLAWGRVFHLYGPGEDPRRLVPSVARALLAGEEAPASDGHQVRDFIHVADVAGGFAALLHSDVEGPVNVASGEPVTILQVLDAIAQASERPELLRAGALPRREGEPERLLAAVERLRGEVGFSPERSLQDGIGETVGWMREQPAP